MFQTGAAYQKSWCPKRRSLAQNQVYKRPGLFHEILFWQRVTNVYVPTGIKKKPVKISRKDAEEVLSKLDVCVINFWASQSSLYKWSGAC